MSSYCIQLYFYLCCYYISVVIVIFKSNQQCILSGL